MLEIILLKHVKFKHKISPSKAHVTSIIFKPYTASVPPVAFHYFAWDTFLTADTSASGQKLYTVSPFAISRFKLDHFKVKCKTFS